MCYIASGSGRGATPAAKEMGICIQSACKSCQDAYRRCLLLHRDPIVSPARRLVKETKALTVGVADLQTRQQIGKCGNSRAIDGARIIDAHASEVREWNFGVEARRAGAMGSSDHFEFQARDAVAGALG